MANSLKVIVIILVVAVIGAFVSLATGAWDPSWNPFGPRSPEAIMSKMIRTMAKVETVASRGEMIVDGGPPQERVKMELTFNSVADERDSANPKAAAEMDFELFSPEGDFSFAFELKMIGQTLYLKATKIPDMPDDAADEFAEMGINLDEFLNQWIRVDQESMRSFYEAAGMSPAEIAEKMREYEKQQEMYRDLAEKLTALLEKRSADLLKIKEVLPDTEINGVAVHHYVAVLDKEGLKKMLPEIVEEIILEYADEDVAEEFKKEWQESREEMLEEMNNSFDMLFGMIGEISVELWIGKEDYYLYRINFEKTIDMGMFMFYMSGMNLFLSFEMNYSDFNQPVTIEAPSEYKTMEEFLLPLLEGMMSPSYYELQEEMIIPPDFQGQDPQYQATERSPSLLQSLPHILQASLLNVPF